MLNAKPKVAIVMGSDSDFALMREAAEALQSLGVTYLMQVVSAHRTPLEMVDFAQEADKAGIRIIIAGAGGAAHLPGMLASLTCLPVIGVPMPHGPLQGQDSLYSIVQMPKGIPVATVAIGGAFNAGLLAAEILATGDSGEAQELKARLISWRQDMRLASLSKVLPNTQKT
ncbi:MAG: 5-(carboxyamino)imidazole ribonucleotide mutase [Proteobacteria bacterium]|nr:5-(carboxyamino)imidazole ribonucleotide mutase [Pseudomonadota bacterium]